jgi:DNA gyrase subunit A
MADENTPAAPAADGEPTGPVDTAAPADAADVVVDPSGDRIEMVDLLTEMQRSYLDYSMAVIVGRALPEVRDGLKPVHRRVLYAMYDGGYRPDRGYFKCARVVGEVMGVYHPHGDTAIYDTLVRLAQPWSMRMPLVDGNGNFGSPGNDPAAAMRYTECKLTPLAMELLREIDEETVDFNPNYDGRSQEPVILPSRFPNLLVNGASGIAVGMATNIPMHNLREVNEGVQWYLQNPEAGQAELLEALMDRIKGPDFPTGAKIVGRRGIEDAYRTGRGSIIMRAVVLVEEINGRNCLVVTELPYQVNPDNLASKIADLVKDGRIQGIADVRDESSSRTGQRLVVVLKRDAVAKVVLNNLYKHTPLQDSFGANMLAMVDGVPRTLSLDAFIRYWVDHQIDVIVRRTKFRLRKAQERDHILLGLLKALDNIDEVIALIRASDTTDQARAGLIGRFDIDEIQANAILEMQLRRLAALERQRIIDEHEELLVKIAEYRAILASPERQRRIVSEELQAITDKYGDARRSELIPFDGDLSIEDLIPEEDIVVTITRGGYVKRTKTEHYRSQKRGGKGVRGAALKQDDIVDHFFTTTTHHWILFFTNKGRVYRAKAYELPDAGRDARGQHVANLLAFQPDESIAQVLDLRDYEVAPYLILATKKGLVKKSALSDYDSTRSGGVIAVNLREDDELIAAELVSAEDDLLLVSKQAQAIRFTASDESLRQTGRATSGVIGMRFREDDELLSMSVVKAGTFVFTVTDRGYGKRTSVERYPVRGRGGLGVIAAKTVDDRGTLIGALIVEEGDEVLAITAAGGVIRTQVTGVRETGRDTMGVQLINVGKKDSVVGIARNPEADVDDADPAESDGSEGVDSDGEPITGEQSAEGSPSPTPTQSEPVQGDTEPLPTEEA